MLSFLRWNSYRKQDETIVINHLKTEYDEKEYFESKFSCCICSVCRYINIVRVPQLIFVLNKK
jgi:hypothetical protein